MRLVRYNPLNEMNRWNSTLDHFFNDRFFAPSRKSNWAPSVDILEKENDVVLIVDVPGMEKEDIKLSIEDKVLTISGERKSENVEEKETYYRRERTWGEFSRSFNLSDDIATDEVEADYKAGILTITLKKSIEKETVKQITIN